MLDEINDYDIEEQDSRNYSFNQDINQQGTPINDIINSHFIIIISHYH